MLSGFEDTPQASRHATAVADQVQGAEAVKKDCGENHMQGNGNLCPMPQLYPTPGQ
jgi:hypothetical protein